MIDDLALWEELWHATKDVVIVGHSPGTHECPFQVGHSLREHVMCAAPNVDAMFKRLIDTGRHVQRSAS